MKSHTVSTDSIFAFGPTTFFEARHAELLAELLGAKAACGVGTAAARRYVRRGFEKRHRDPSISLQSCD
jgi:hypothetical protein